MASTPKQEFSCTPHGRPLIIYKVTKTVAPLFLDHSPGRRAAGQTHGAWNIRRTGETQGAGWNWSADNGARELGGLGNVQVARGTRRARRSPGSQRSARGRGEIRRRQVQGQQGYGTAETTASFLACMHLNKGNYEPT